MEATRQRSSSHKQTSSAEDDANSALWADAYTDLLRCARRRLARERADDVFSPTTLVHETYLRLHTPTESWVNVAHLLACASRTMSWILIDTARRRNRWERSQVTYALRDALVHESLDFDTLLSLREELARLKSISPKAHSIVVQRFYLDQSESGIATALGITERTVRRHLVRGLAILDDLISR